MKDSEIKKPNTLPMEEDIDKFFKQIRKVIADTDGQCIFRGENEDYKLICSSLAQDYPDEIQAEHFNLAKIQEQELEKMASYTESEDQYGTLAEVRHQGGKVALIDFSYDYNVALFFACGSELKEFKKDGRIIIVNTSKLPKDIKVIDPNGKLNIRIAPQKSVLIHPLKRNYLYEKKEEEFITVIPISQILKQEIKKRLSEHHGIKTETIYKDIFGYIQNQSIHQDDETFFYKGVSLEERKKYEEAIIAFTESIARSPNMEAYANRGSVYEKQGNYDLAILDYTEAMRLDPNAALVYRNRGAAYVKQGKYDLAISDFTEAIRLDPNHAIAYCIRAIEKTKITHPDNKGAIIDAQTALRLANAQDNTELAHWAQVVLNKLSA